MKIVFIVSHVLFGVAGTICAMISLHHLLKSEPAKFKRYASWEFLSTLVAALTGGWYYVYYYQQDKPIILNGAFPLAHHLFMEVKEHLFIALFLISLFLQIRIRFTTIASDIGFQKESKEVLYSLIVLGLSMSVMGVFVSMGFRVNQ